MTLPFGSLFFALCTALALAPIRRPRQLALFSWISTAVPNELTLQFMVIVGLSEIPTVADGDLAEHRLSLAVALFILASLAVVTWRALRARPALERALDNSLGPLWRAELEPDLARELRQRRSWARILLLPWPFRPRDIVRLADIPYGEDGRSNLLDVYRHRLRPNRAPTLIYLHGGGFRSGHKKREGRPLVHRLARAGWTCISANYHLAPTPGAGFPDHLIDVKKVIAWARTTGRDHGVDPDTIVLAGSSAGAHLTVMSALTANDPSLQPGFEDADTSVSAGVGLYGYYGQLDADRPVTGPLAHLRTDAPPFFVVHGDHDTYTPVEGARALVDGLLATSSQPVAYAELPGAQHSFDLFHSIRFEAVVDAIEAFAAHVRGVARVTN
jgi:acetyl esterase/lipase